MTPGRLPPRRNAFGLKIIQVDSLIVKTVLQAVPYTRWHCDNWEQ